MLTSINLEKCLARFKDQYEASKKDITEFRPTITMSPMTGTGGDVVAVKLMDYLQHHAPPGRQWAIFDKNLMTKVLEEHGLSQMMADSPAEAKEPLVSQLLNKLRTGHPSASKIVELAVETVWNLATGGYVILVGRAANVVTADLKNVFHVRLVGSLSLRVENTKDSYHYDRRTAANFVKSEDEDKRLYMKEYFGKDIDDPELYHIMVNTDRIPPDTTAHLIGNAFLNWFKSASATRAK
jgi:cytidylate kinase